MVRSLLAVFAFALLSIGAVGVARADTRGLALHYEKPMAPGQGFAVSVSKDVWATVHVTGWRGRTVHVDASTAGPYADRVRYYEAVQGGTRTLKFFVQRPPGASMFGWFGEMLPRAQIDVRVPQDAQTSVDATKGHVTVNSVTGPLTISLVLGGIDVHAAGDVLKINTVNGIIDADIRSLNARPDIDIQTVNGSITVVAPAALAAPVDASTVNGSVRNTLPHSRGPGSIKLGTVNGNVSIGPRP
jgi:hypothetical protein